MKPEQIECPSCGKIVRLKRLGVWLTPVKARIVELIQKRPGIEAETINKLVFDDATTLVNVRIHIHQINNLLVETDYRIRSQRNSGYRVVRV